MSSTKRPLRCAVLGYGKSATVFHIPFILALPHLFTLHSVLERKATPEKSAARDDHPGVKVVTTLDQVLQDAEVDLVFITTINSSHFEYAQACLNAGKHCVVEKPLTPTSTEAYELAKLAKDKKRVLAVYQNRRWDSDFLTVKDLLQKGTFGELSEFESHFDRFKNEPTGGNRAWKDAGGPGSGSAFDLGSHLVDQLLSLFGKPKSVTAIVRNARLLGEASDSFQIFLHYDPTSVPGRKLPLLAVAQGSMLSHVSPQLRFVVRGTEAAFVKHGLDVQEDQLGADASNAVSQSSFGVEPESLQGTLYTAKGSSKVHTHRGSYRSWFENVAHAVGSNDAALLEVTPEQAALTIAVIEAAVRSSEEGRRIDL